MRVVSVQVFILSAIVLLLGGCSLTLGTSSSAVPVLPLLSPINQSNGASTIFSPG